MFIYEKYAGAALVFCDSSLKPNAIMAILHFLKWAGFGVAGLIGLVIALCILYLVGTAATNVRLTNEHFLSPES